MLVAAGPEVGPEDRKPLSHLRIITFLPFPNMAHHPARGRPEMRSLGQMGRKSITQFTGHAWEGIEAKVDTKKGGQGALPHPLPCECSHQEGAGADLKGPGPPPDPNFVAQTFLTDSSPNAQSQ